MAPSIIANPNPVPYAWPVAIRPGGSAVTTVSWDTDGNAEGEVFRSEDGGATETRIAGGAQAGNRRGSVDAPVGAGETVLFRLRNANNGNLLAEVTVTTTETPALPLAVPEVLEYWGTSQGVYNLNVVPEADSVWMTFRTRQPTNPFVEVVNAQTGKLAGLWARPQRTTAHEMLFEGYGGPMAQNTPHTYRIVAQPMKGSSDPRKAEEVGRFVTGSRTVTFFFDRVIVHNDADPGMKGAGEISFTFGAGDLLTGDPLGNVESFPRTDIRTGNAVDVNRVITIPTSPRGLWAQVNAHEDDGTFPGGISAVGMRPSAEPPGSTVREEGDFVRASITEHFDVTEPVVGTVETPFKMATPPFALAFEVQGRLRVEALAGEWLRAAGPLRPQLLSPTVSARVLVPTRSATLGGESERRSTLVLHPDGAVYHRLSGGRGATGDEWTNLGGSFEGPLAVVGGRGGDVSLFGLSPDGAVLHRTTGADGDWRSLGGSFAGPVVAVAGEDGAVEVFARDEDGSVLHRSLPQTEPQAEEWEPVGAEIGVSMAALFSLRTGLSLFALGREGEVLHKRRPPQEGWEPRGEEWEPLGRASTGTLSAEWVGEDTAVLCVVAEDETVSILAWRGYPHEPPREGWQTIGTVNSLLQARIPERVEVDDAHTEPST